MKLANASHADVDLRVTAQGLAITVRDNGDGFNPQALQPGLALGSIAARVGRVGGTGTISAAPGAGTILTAVLPLSVE